MKYQSIITTIVLYLPCCGVDYAAPEEPNTTQSENASDSRSNQEAGDTGSSRSSDTASLDSEASRPSSSADATSSDEFQANDEDLSIIFSGYVGGIFEVIVDGEDYSSLEDFYTQELKRLPEKVADAGYNSDYKIFFEAEVGYQDFWRDMDVWIAPIEKKGYQGQGRVNNDGKFAITLPGAAIDQHFKVKANKRINIILTKGPQQTKICYNFAALEKDIALVASDDPIILRDFTTTITAYDCNLQSSGGIKVPRDSQEVTPDSPQPSTAKIKKGDSKDRVIALLGNSELVDNGSSLCWVNPNKLASVCKAMVSKSCHCRVDFNELFEVIDMQGLAKEWMTN